MSETNISYLSASEAQQVDAELMGPSVKYRIEQLMELAGLSVAEALPVFCKILKTQAPKPQTVVATPGFLVLVGPGNNGGDGLVAARHLRLFGFAADIVCPTPPKKELYADLLKQAREHGAQVFEDLPADLSPYSVLVDAIFGFSFRGPLRAPYLELIQKAKATGLPVFSVDVPSGCNVDSMREEEGDEGFSADGLISLTAPKLCVKNFKGVHFLGGRFVPKSIKQKFSLVLPEYPGTSGIVRLS